MRDSKTGMSFINMADSLWHMKLNRNLLHLDQNLLGQVVRVPIHPDGASLEHAVHLQGGKARNGYGPCGVHGVVIAIENDLATVQMAGYALMLVDTPVINEFAYVQSDGTAVAVSQANMESGIYDPQRIIGAIVDTKANKTGVLVGSKGMWEGIVAADGMAADGLLAAPGPLSGKALVVDGEIERDGTLVRGHNISGAAVTTNTMTITLQQAFAGIPSVHVGKFFTTPVHVEFYASASTIVLKCFDLDGLARNFSTLTGNIHVFASGVSA